MDLLFGGLVWGEWVALLGDAWAKGVFVSQGNFLGEDWVGGWVAGCQPLERPPRRAVM